MNVSATIMSGRKTKTVLEKTMKGVFIACGAFTVIAVLVITIYMVVSGAPAMFKIGLKDFLFGTEWAPTAADPKFGILPMILTSLVGTGITILIGVPIALLAAVFVSEVAHKKLAGVVKPAIELLAGIPSVVYGLLGMILLVPQVSKLETLLYAGDPTHTFTGGANLLSGVIVLTIMILPTVVNISITSLKAVPRDFMEASLATGATKMQTIFKVQIPAAKSGVITGVVLGIGRAIGEAMAIILVSGNVVNMPGLFNSVRFLTTGIVSEMSYASGLHREALFSIGLVLFIFIMVINVMLNTLLKKEAACNEK
ncbi:MAG: phosphate ABC transporter permease subunit PstC [Christensenella sp.]